MYVHITFKDEHPYTFKGTVTCIIIYGLVHTLEEDNSVYEKHTLLQCLHYK